MIVALRMRVVSTGKHYWTMTADYPNEVFAQSAALKRYPGCVVSRCTFPTKTEYDTFVAFVRDHPEYDMEQNNK
jgi:hypothetical protein